MEKAELLRLLEEVKNGSVTPEDAALKLKQAPFEDLGYAVVDHHRALRQGAKEVIYGAGKTPEQMDGILHSMESRGETDIIITRLAPEAAEMLKQNHDLDYDPLSRFGLVNPTKTVTAPGFIAVVSGGTSDMPVCEEAARTAEALGNRVERMYDVGVAGLHRLLDRKSVV